MEQFAWPLLYVVRNVTKVKVVVKKALICVKKQFQHEMEMQLASSI